MTRLRIIFLNGLIVSFGLLLASCGSDSGFNENEDFIKKEGAVQFVNMMPDSPEVTMVHGLSNTLVPYATATPVSVRFEDNYDWRVAYIGSSNEEVTLAEGINQTISERVLTTFLYFGTTAQTDVQIVDYLITPIEDRPEGQTDVWFAVNSTNPMVDIYITEFGSLLVDSEPLITLGSGSRSDRISIAAGTTKQLRVTGASSQALLFDSGSIEIPDQGLELFGIIDDFGPDGESHVDVIRSITANGGKIDDISQATALRSVNLSTTSPIDIVVGSTTFANLTRGQETNYLDANPGAQTLTVTSGDLTLLDDTITVGSNDFFSLLVFDALEDQTADSLQTLDRLRPVVDRSTFQFVNGTQQAVDMYLLRDGGTIENTPPAINDVLFSVSGPLEVRPGQVEFVVTNADNSETFASLGATLTESLTYTLVFDTEDVLHLLED